MSVLHPTMARALAPFAPPQSEVHQIAANDAKARALEHYRAALRDLDPQGEFIEDGAQWRSWRCSLEICRALQREVDPTGEVWFEILGCGHGVPRPDVRLPDDVRAALDVIATADARVQP